VIEIDTKAGEFTSNVVLALSAPREAVMVVVPYPVVVANPFVPAVLLMLATPLFDDDQLTDPVRNRVLPSL
jgi:hypothetical protein